MLIRPRKVGFSMIEMVVAISILTVLGAAVIPATNNYLTQKRISDTGTIIDSLNWGFFKFRTAIGRYPANLSLLANVPVASNDNFQTSCGTAAGATAANRQFTAANVTSWSSSGPFYPQYISSTGVRTPIGIITDRMKRVPTTITGTNITGMMEVYIPNVDYSDALALNQLFDGTGDVNAANRTNSTGMIRWTTTPSATETITVYFLLPVGKVC